MTTETKYAGNLRELISKYKGKYNEIKRIFNDNIIGSISSINAKKLSDNRAKLLRVFHNLRDVFTGEVYEIKIYDDKYDIIKLKNNSVDKKSKLETQNNSLELYKEKEPNFEENIPERTKIRKQKSEKQPDATNMPGLESEESAAHSRNQQGKGLKIFNTKPNAQQITNFFSPIKRRNKFWKFQNEIKQILYSLIKNTYKKWL